MLGSIKRLDGSYFQRHKTCYHNINFATYNKFSFNVAYMSGILFLREKIDFQNLWYEYSSSNSYGFLDVYPHRHLFNLILLNNSLITHSSVFVTIRDRGDNFVNPINNNHYFHPTSRFIQLEKNLLFVSDTLPKSFHQVATKLRLIYLYISSINHYLNFNQDSLDYYSLDYTESVNAKQVVKSSLLELKKSKLIDEIIIKSLPGYMLLKYAHSKFKCIYKLF
jgi:hypothetical protein